MLETAGEIVSQDSDTEQAYLAFICKRLKLNFRKLSVEERKWLKKIAEKSDLLKNPNRREDEDKKCLNGGSGFSEPPSRHFV